MTVSTTDSVVEYVSGGPAFPIPYRFLQNSDIEAVLVDQDGVSETLVLGTQYTLAGAGSQNGGTLTSAYAAGVLATPGATFTISRVMDAVQPTDLRNQGRFLAETHETVFDRLTMLIQQGFAGLSRALLRPIGKNYYDAQGRRIANVGDPTADGDAVNKLSMQQYVGSVIGSGTGPINLASNVVYIAPNGVPRTVQDMSGSDGADLIGFQTQTLGDAMRAVRGRTLYAKDMVYGFVDSVSADNTGAAVALLNAAQNGDTIDFCGTMWRIYASVTGVASATATPATTEAVPLTSVPRLIGKRDITIQNGGLYVANQGVAPEKRYFPSTLYIKGCDNIRFGAGAQFESKGESYGDADASQPLDVNARQDFLAKNGGHAVVMVRSSNISGTLTARLAGSCSPVYPSSCYNVRLWNSFSNPASLGYAGYCMDAWCGDTTVTGFPEHSLYLYNCNSHREALTRREDGLAVGSAIYSSKNGVLNEDPSVVTYVIGGYYADCYGNSDTNGFQQGAAFGSGSSHMSVIGARIHNVSYAASTAVTSNFTGSIRLSNVTGDAGAAVYYAYKNSFASMAAEFYECQINITNTRFILEITESAYFINNAQNIPVNIYARGCRFSGAKQIAWKPNKLTNLSYGGMTIDGGTYETSGYLCNISGWGGAAAGTRQGFVIKGGARIFDISDNTDTYVIASNSANSGAILCYVWWDLRDCEIQTKTPRNVAGLTVSGATSLQERIWYPERFESAYSTSAPRYSPQQSVTFLSLNGLAGSNQRIIVRCNGRFPLKLPTAIIGTGGKVVGIAGQQAAAAYNSATGNLEHEIICDGVPAAGILVAGTEYPVM